MKGRTLFNLVALAILTTLLLSACAAPAAQAPSSPAAATKPAATAVAAAPQAPAAANATAAPAAKTNLGTANEIKAAKSWKIGVVIKNTVNPYYVRMTEGANQAGKDFNVTITVLAPQKPDNVEEQIRIMEDLISQKVDGIVIAPTDTNGLAPVIDKAVDAKIPVIALGTPVNTKKVLTFTGFDNITAGRMMGEWIVQQLGGKGNVVILEGPPGQKNAEDRRNGFLEGLKKGQMNVLAQQTAQWQRAEAMRVTEDWLQRFPKIDAILGSNDEMGLGASEAWRASNRKDKVLITGFDANKDALIAIKEGRMSATIDQVPDKQVRQAIQLMIRHLDKGETFPPELPWQDITMATQENISKFVQ